jgi:hypothetical protein
MYHLTITIDSLINSLMYVNWCNRLPPSHGGPEPIHSRYFFDHPPPSSSRRQAGTAINGSNPMSPHGGNNAYAASSAASSSSSSASASPQKRDRYARVSDGGFNALGAIQQTPTPTPDASKSFDSQLDAATAAQQRQQHEAGVAGVLALVHEETDRETKEPMGAPLATLHSMSIRPTLNLTDLRAFLFNPLPPGITVKAFIRRRKKSMPFNHFFLL